MKYYALFLQNFARQQHGHQISESVAQGSPAQLDAAAIESQSRAAHATDASEKVRLNSGVLSAQPATAEPELPDPLESRSPAEWEAHAQPLGTPPAMQEKPGLEFCDSGPLSGLWLVRYGDTWWINFDHSTMPSYCRFWAVHSSAQNGANEKV